MNLTNIHKFFEEITFLVAKDQANPNSDTEYHPQQGWKIHVGGIDTEILAHVEWEQGEYKVSVAVRVDNSLEQEYSSEMRAEHGYDPYAGSRFPMPKSKSIKLQFARSFDIKATTKDVAKFLLDCQSSAYNKL